MRNRAFDGHQPLAKVIIDAGRDVVSGHSINPGRFDCRHCTLLGDEADVNGNEWGGDMNGTAGRSAIVPEPELSGQTVVVIGGSLGIGLETAKRAHGQVKGDRGVAVADGELGARAGARMRESDRAGICGYLARDLRHRRQPAVRCGVAGGGADAREINGGRAE